MRSALLTLALVLLAGCAPARVPVVTTIALDEIDTRHAHRCMKQGFAITVWTDGMNTRVTCAARY